MIECAYLVYYISSHVPKSCNRLRAKAHTYQFWLLLRFMPNFSADFQNVLLNWRRLNVSSLLIYMEKCHTIFSPNKPQQLTLFAHLSEWRTLTAGWKVGSSTTAARIWLKALARLLCSICMTPIRKCVTGCKNVVYKKHFMKIRKTDVCLIISPDKLASKIPH